MAGPMAFGSCSRPSICTSPISVPIRPMAGATSAARRSTATERISRARVASSSRRMTASMVSPGAPSQAMVMALCRKGSGRSRRSSFSSPIRFDWRATCASLSICAAASPASCCAWAMALGTRRSARIVSPSEKDMVTMESVPPSTISRPGRLRKAASELPVAIAAASRPKPRTSPARLPRSRRRRATAGIPPAGTGRAGKRCTCGRVFAMTPRSSGRAVHLDDLGHGDPEALVDDHHLAARDQPVVDVDVDGLADLAVELDHGAAPELEELADLHRRAAEDGRDLDGNVVYGFELLRRMRLAVVGAALLLRFRRRGGVQFLEIEVVF